MLSLAGRTVLIQASSTAILSYVMQCSYLPKKFLDGIDRVNKGSRWMVGRDSNLNVWHSNWLSKGTL